MKLLDNIYNHLQRQTVSTSFIPQIDGLRFLAIFTVVMVHLNDFVVTKIPVALNKSTLVYAFVRGVLFGGGSGRKSVLLFFAISGFILGMPFARAAMGQGKAVDLKRYYLRRLTRLEPPYILVMVACFFGILLLPGHEFAAGFPHTFLGLLPRLGASLIYMHNIIFPQYLSINAVAWSLEIEVQFYLLVPLLVLVFRLPKISRRVLLAVVIILLTVLQHIFPLNVYSIYGFLQYFLLGFLLVDLYLSGVNLKINPRTAALLGAVVFMAAVGVDLYHSIFTELSFIALLLGFCFLVLTNKVWQKVFSLRFFTAIGGMCYSIYLLHTIIISFVGNYTITHNISKLYPVAYLWHAAILLPVILICSTIFYLLIERPCMDRDWPAKLWTWFRKFVGLEKPQTTSPTVIK